jgi:hypothetical protein
LRGTSLCDSVFECTPSRVGTLCEEQGWLGQQVDFSLWYTVGIVDPISDCNEMMRLKDEYNGCILLQAIQNPFVEIAIKSPYRNSHFIPAVCKVQKAFKAATKRIESTAHLVVIPVLENNHFGTVCVAHPEDLMLEFDVRTRPYVVVMNSIAGYFDSSKIANVAVR